MYITNAHIPSLFLCSGGRKMLLNTGIPYPLKFFKISQTMLFLYHVWIIKLSLILSIYRKKYDTQNK